MCQSLPTSSQVLRPTSYGKWVGRPMYLKRGNFSFQARTAQNQLRMGKYGTYLEFSRSQEAPKHCPTFDSLIQCCAIAHFRLPPVCPRFAPSLPPVWLPLHFCHWFLSDGESIFLSTCFLEGKSDEKRGDESWGGKVKFENKQGAWGGLGRWVAGRGGEWVVIVQIDSDFCSCQCRIWT